jgi:dephospho-CoA kinase
MVEASTCYTFIIANLVMKLLGLTGNIACGKSTVASFLRDRGAAVLDADLLVHELYSDTDFATQVAALFGENIVNSLGMIDRPALGKIVFSDTSALRRLELLVHPAVGKLREKKLAELAVRPEPPQVVVLEAVKLLESGQGRDCHVVWCVRCRPETQLQRLQEIRGLSKDEAQKRLESQPSYEAKLQLAQQQNVPLVFVENDGTPEELQERVGVLWNELQSTVAVKS